MIRHGRPDEAWVGTHYGQTDVDLSDRGRAQSLAIVERYADTQLDAIYSSDLLRAHWLADRLAEARGLSVPRLSALRERSIGIFHRMTYAEGQAAFPEEAALMRVAGGMHRPSGGENLPDLAARVLPAMAEIVRSHPGQTVVVVGHGGPMRVVLGDVLEMAIENVERITVDYCGVCILDHAKTPPRVRQING